MRIPYKQSGLTHFWIIKKDDRVFKSRYTIEFRVENDRIENGRTITFTVDSKKGKLVSCNVSGRFPEYDGEVIPDIIFQYAVKFYGKDVNKLTI